MGCKEMRRENKQQKIALAVGIALSAGVFSIMPSASAAPVLDHVVRGGAVVDQKTTPNVTDVTSTTRNNVIDWKDFSVAQGETVRFDGGEKINNYLNVVSGANTSHIDGAIKGGNDVYIVNPNGVIFGNSASVDVGSLYVSSRPLSEVDYTNIDANADTMQPLVNATSSLSGDIVNMGTVQADYVYVEGNNVKFMDTAQVKTAAGNAVNDNVKIVAEGAIRLGHRPEEMTAAVSTKRAKLLTSNRSGYSLTSGLGTTNFTTITNQSELEGINTTGLSGDYELGNDITISGEYTPVGNADSGAFKGNFDGNYFTVSGIKVSSGNYGGLFGYTDGATIKNVGVSEVDITADYAGGIVGKAEDTTLTNVFNAGGDVKAGDKGGDYDFYVGGIAGYINKTDIEVAYNHATVPSETGGGIVGTIENSTKHSNGTAYVIKHAYDDVKNPLVAYTVSSGYTNNTEIDDVYTTGADITSEFAELNDPNVYYTNASSKAVTSYSNFDISNSGSDDTIWRIYEGQTTPLLRPLLRKGVGPVTVTYNYTHGSNDSGSNNGADLTADDITYNANYVVADTTSADYGDTSGFSNFDSSKIKYSGDEAVRNVSTQALFYSTQTGYDLIGNNVTMAKKKVSVSGASSLNISKVYDGKTDVTAAFKEAFNESDSGIEAADAEIVKVGFTDDFKANFADKKAEENKDITFTGGLTLTYDEDDKTAVTLANNYDVDTSALDDVVVKGTITQRPIYLNFTEPQNGIKKTYDGTDTVTTALTNVFALDEAEIQKDDNGTQDTVSLQTTSSTPVYVDKETHVEATDTTNGYKAVNAGDKAVKVTGVSLTGNDADNYVLYYGDSEVTNSTVYLDGTIEQKEITLTDFSVVDADGNAKTGSKVYDGSSAYTISSNDNLQYGNGVGIVERDNGKISFALAGTGSYFADSSGAATKYVADATQIAYSAQAVTSDSTKNPLSNYKYKDANNVYHTLGTDTISVFGDGEIKRRELTVDLQTTSGIEKDYNQSPDLPKGGDYTTFGSNYVNYANVTAYKLVKDDSSVPDDAEDDADISITASYAATGSEGAAGVYRNDAYEVVENGKIVNFYVTMTGDDAKNYKVNGTEAENLSTTPLALTGHGTIKPLALTPTFAVIEKTYNGTAAINDGDAVIKGTQTTPTSSNVGTVTGLENDNVSLVYNVDEASFSDSNASDTAKTITYSGLSLEGDQAHNYKLAGGTEAEGTGYINRRLILKDSFTVNGDKAAKTYDGSSTYTLTDGAVLMADVAESGQTGVVTADQEYLHFSLDSAGNTHFVTVDGNGDITDDDAKTVAGANKVAYAIIATADSGKEYLLDNYKIGTTTSAQDLTNNGQYSVTGDGKITRRELTITAANATGIDKPYDTTAAVLADYTGIGNKVKYADGSPELVSGDGTAWNINASYNSADVYRDDSGQVVENGKEVTFNAYLSGDAANNYTINGTDAETYTQASPYELAQKGKGKINPLTITPVFKKITKTYTGTEAITDGNAYIKINDTDTVNVSDFTDNDSRLYTLPENLDGTNVTLKYSTDVENAFYDGAGYGAHTITYKGLSLEGTKSGNYELSSTTITGAGQINKATIGMSDLKFTFADVKREYNGDTAVGDDIAADFVTDAYIDFGDGNNAVKFTYTGIDSAVYSSAGDGTSVAGVGTGKSVTYTISGITVPDSVLANFEWDSNDPFTSTKSYTEDGVGTITPKTVYATINNPTVTKTYNASDDVQINGSPVTGAALVNITGLVGGSQNTSTAVYTDVNHGEDKEVKYTISVSDGENYNIYYNSADTNADSYIMGYAADGSSVISTVTTPNNVINQRDLKMTFNPVTKVYDGYTAYGNSTVVNGGAAYSFDDLQGSDALTVADGYTANASYNSANVSEANTVTYDKLTINGNDAGNYRLLDADGNVLTADADGKYTTTGEGTISKYTLTSAPTVNFYHVNKEYDGTSDVVYSRTASENDPRKFINATVTTGSGTEALGFDLVSAVYTGGSAVNSDDGQTIRAGGTQNPAEFIIKFSTDNYEFSSGVMGADFTQLADGSYQYSATYNDATITPRTITVTLGDTLADTTNHYVTKTYNSYADVQQSINRNLFNFGADDVLTKTDGTLDNVYLAYNNTAGNAVQAVYDDKNAGDNKDVTYTLALAGDDAANYKLNTTILTGKGDIQKAALTIGDNTFDYVEKTYDGNANVTTLTADKVHLTGVQKADGTYETINVGNNAIWDGTGDSTNKIIGTYDSPNVQWQVGTDEEAYQGVTYSNLQNALESMTDGDGLAISTNYTIADTKYFAAAKEKGRIMAIAITQNATRNWTPVTREYNADDNVDGVVYAYDPVTGTKGDMLLNTNDILKLTVTDKDGNAITVDYTATANFNDKNVGDNKTLNYTIESVDKKVKDGDGNRNYKLSNDVYNELLNDPDGKNISDTNNQITKRQLNAVVQQDSNITKVYDGTKNASADNFVLDEEDRKVLEKDGYNVAEVIQKTAAYRDENATISPGEANTNSLTIDYTMTTTADAQNYEVSTPSAVATGDIVRRTISLNATPVSVNVGESMPGFTGTITGFVGSEAGSYSDFINGVTFKAADGATTSTPGSYGVYGWYMGSKSGILGNYIFDQAAANATAFTVNYVNNDTGNPDTKITPNNDIYHQISKDMGSGFGDTGAAAIEYKDKSGNVIASETIDSGEIHGTGLEISSGASDMSKQADSNANIGIAGSEIVNMDGANAAGSVSIESTGEGTVVNLEVFSIDGDTQTGDNNAAAEITNAADKTNSLEVDNTTDTAGTSGSIAITNEKQNIIGEELEDKEEEQEKEGEIAIKSSNGEDEDEIELTVEDEGVNVA